MTLRQTRVVVAAMLLASALSASAACAAAPRGRLYVRVGPPVTVAERFDARPGYVWVPGYYRWSGRDYVWVRGEYVRPPRARAAWVPGRWAHDRRGWYFIDGHWR